VPTRQPRPGTTAPPPPRRTGLIIALGLAIVAVGALLAVLLWPNDRADEDTTSPTTTQAPQTTAPPTTEPSTTAPATEPSTSAPTATTAPEPVDTSTVVFPGPSSGVRYDDPVDAARGFAVDFVGFTDPLVGEFARGDARSGEVQVRPTARGPVTTVFVRQLGTDGTWWVLGSATANIAIDSPGPGDAIASPVAVSGNALAWEGVVNVEIRQDGSRQPLGTGVVTGGGDTMRPFAGEIEYSTPTADRGAIVFVSHSAMDGRVWQAAVVRVSFA
jgi:Immunoglobulin-like domain of bacterial spore germination